MSFLKLFEHNKNKNSKKPRNESLISLLIQIKEGDKKLREEFISSYKPFILSVIVSIFGKGIDTENSDEYSLGFEAFNNAIDKYDVYADSSFIMFAEQAIKWKLYDYIRKKSKTIKEYPFTYFENEEDEAYEDTIISSYGLYDFENDNVSNYTISTVENSKVANSMASLKITKNRKLSGIYSMEENLIFDGDIIFNVNNIKLGITAGKTITFYVFIPGINIKQMSPFIEDSDENYYYNWVECSKLDLSKWNGYTLTVPSNVKTPIKALGLKAQTDGVYNAHIYIDNISWPVN